MHFLAPSTSLTVIYAVDTRLLDWSGLGGLYTEAATLIDETVEYGELLLRRARLYIRSDISIETVLVRDRSRCEKQVARVAANSWHDAILWRTAASSKLWFRDDAACRWLRRHSWVPVILI